MPKCTANLSCIFAVWHDFSR